MPFLDETINYGTAHGRLDDGSSYISHLALADVYSCLHSEAKATNYNSKITHFLNRSRSALKELSSYIPSVTDFETCEIIASGQFGDVHHVKSRRKWDTEDYALKSYDAKLLLNSLSKKERSLQHCIPTYETERDLLALANSPWIPALYRAWYSNDHLYLLMERVAGGDFSGFFSQQTMGTMPMDDAIVSFFLAEALEALQYIHNLGFIHRAFEPENILIDARGHLKLCGFSSAGACAVGQRVGPAWSIACNPLYSSPELLARTSIAESTGHGLEDNSGIGSHSQATDLWSLGIVGYEMLNGITPFSKSRPTYATVRAIVNFEEDVLEWHVDTLTISPNLVNLIHALLSKENSRPSAETVRNHDAFATINWSNLRNEISPILPDLKETSPSFLGNSSFKLPSTSTAATNESEPSTSHKSKSDATSSVRPDPPDPGPGASRTGRIDSVRRLESTQSRVRSLPLQQQQTELECVLSGDSLAFVGYTYSRVLSKNVQGNLMRQDDTYLKEYLNEKDKEMSQIRKSLSSQTSELATKSAQVRHFEHRLSVKDETIMRLEREKADLDKKLADLQTENTKMSSDKRRSSSVWVNSSAAMLHHQTLDESDVAANISTNAVNELLASQKKTSEIKESQLKKTNDFLNKKLAETMNEVETLSKQNAELSKTCDELRSESQRLVSDLAQAQETSKLKDERRRSSTPWEVSLELHIQKTGLKSRRSFDKSHQLSFNSRAKQTGPSTSRVETVEEEAQSSPESAQNVYESPIMTEERKDEALVMALEQIKSLEADVHDANRKLAERNDVLVGSHTPRHNNMVTLHPKTSTPMRDAATGADTVTRKDVGTEHSAKAGGEQGSIHSPDVSDLSRDKSLAAAQYEGGAGDAGGDISLEYCTPLNRFRNPGSVQQSHRQQQHDCCSSAVAKLNREVGSLTAKIELLELLQENAKQLEEKLREDIVSEEGKNVDLQSQIEQLTKQIKELEENESRTYSHILEDNSKIKQQKAEMRLKNRELERKLMIATSDFDKQKSEAVAEHTASMEKDQIEKNKAIAELNEVIASLESEKTALSSRVETLTVQLRQQKEDQSEEHTKIVSQLSEFQSKLDGKDVYIQELESVKAALKEACMDLEDQIAVFERRANENMNRYQTTLIQLNAARDTTVDSNSQIRRLEKELEIATSGRSSMDERSNRLEAELTNLRSTTAEQLTELSAQLASKNALIDDYIEQIHKEETIRNRVERSLRAAESQNDRLREENRSLEMEARDLATRAGQEECRRFEQEENGRELGDQLRRYKSEKDSLNAQLTDLHETHRIDRIKFEQTLAQQGKLIAHLQSSQKNQPKRKAFGGLLSGSHNSLASELDYATLYQEQRTKNGELVSKIKRLEAISMREDVNRTDITSSAASEIFVGTGGHCWKKTGVVRSERCAGCADRLLPSREAMRCTHCQYLVHSQCVNTVEYCYQGSSTCPSSGGNQSIDSFSTAPSGGITPREEGETPVWSTMHPTFPSSNSPLPAEQGRMTGWVKLFGDNSTWHSYFCILAEGTLKFFTSNKNVEHSPVQIIDLKLHRWNLEYKKTSFGSVLKDKDAGYVIELKLNTNLTFCLMTPTVEARDRWLRALEFYASPKATSTPLLAASPATPAFFNSHNNVANNNLSSKPPTPTLRSAPSTTVRPPTPTLASGFKTPNGTPALKQRSVTPKREFTPTPTLGVGSALTADLRRLFKLNRSDDITVNCATIYEDKLFLGCDEGLHYLNLTETDDRVPVPVPGGPLPVVHCICFIDCIDTFVMVTGPDRVLSFALISNLKTVLTGEGSSSITERLRITYQKEITKVSQATWASIGGTQNGKDSGRSSQSDIYLAVVLPKSILLMSYSDEQQFFVTKRHIDYAVNCLAFLPSEKSIFFGSDGKFLRHRIIDDVTSDLLDENEPNLVALFDRLCNNKPSEKTVAVVSVGYSELLLVFKSFGVFVNGQGKVSRSDTIEWKRAPLEVVFDDPFLIVTSNEGVDIIILSEESSSVPKKSYSLELPTVRWIGDSYFRTTPQPGLTEVYTLGRQSLPNSNRKPRTNPRSLASPASKRTKQN